MADPRLAVAFDELDAEYAPFIIDGSSITYSATADGGSTKVGRAVTLSAASTIATAADGEPVLGKLIKVEPDGIATVQVGGAMTFIGGDSASLTHGKKIVGAVEAVTAAEGCIREVATETAAELGLQCGMILDASDTDAVVVYL